MSKTVQNTSDISKNMPGEQGKRYVVRSEERWTGFITVTDFVVWDRETTERVYAYPSRIGANHLAFGLNLGWDLTSTLRTADNADVWASAS